MRVSLQDIAQHLGLHRSTVSRALRHDPSIPAKTRTRIQAACHQLGYRPNSLISELASARWQTAKVAQGISIAYLQCNELPGSIDTELINSLTKQANILGYHLDVFQRKDFSDSAKLQRVLRSRGITDVILGPVYNQAYSVELDWSQFIIIQLLPGTVRLPLHSVVQDHFNMVVMLWQKVVSQGYHRVGITLLDHGIKLMDDILRLSAVHACQEQLFPKLAKIPPFLYTPYDLRIKDFVSWSKRHRPDVLIGFSSAHYYIYQTAFEHPIPYACLHKTDPIGLSGIPEASLSCGREAINLLHMCRKTYQWGIPKERIDHMIEPIWFEGNSLPRKVDSAL